jgi:hypothetical protein
VSILDPLLNWLNPTHSWIAQPSIPIEMDLDSNRLSGVGIGDRFERLAFLGPGKWAKPRLNYPKAGIHFLLDENQLISNITFFFGHKDEPTYGKYCGSFRYRGNSISFDPSTPEHQIEHYFGEAYHRDHDDDEVVRFYERRSAEWQIEFGKDGCLKCWLIESNPLMADAYQRESYGVTKPWPPTSS